jgi:menaquinone-dependent protoporphyrinogen oxidase
MAPSILVIYGTNEGQTAKIATEIAATLRSQSVAVTLASAASPWTANPADYSAVIVAASVHIGRFQKSVRAWVRAHREALQKRPSAFIAVCLAVLNRTPKVEQDIQAILGRFSQETGWQPTETKVVAGAVKYTKYGWLTRWVMKRIVAKAGGDTDTSRDYEYTDWDDLREFSMRFFRDVAPKVPEQTTSVASGR